MPHQPHPRQPFSTGTRDYEGPEQVLQVFARLFELSGGTFSFELHDVLANDEHAVALFTVRGERAGTQLNDSEVLVCHFRDGNVSKVWLQSTDLYAQDEFWSSPPGRICRPIAQSCSTSYGWRVTRPR